MVQLAVQFRNPLSHLVVEPVDFIDAEFDEICFGMMKVLLNFLRLAFEKDG